MWDINQFSWVSLMCTGIILVIKLLFVLLLFPVVVFFTVESQLQHQSFQWTPRTDLLAVQGTLKNLLQYHHSKASVLLCSAFIIVQLSHPYMTTGKTIALTRWTFVDKVMFLLFNILSKLVITFLPRSKHLLISWLKSPSGFQTCTNLPYFRKTCTYKQDNLQFWCLLL